MIKVKLKYKYNELILISNEISVFTKSPPPFITTLSLYKISLNIRPLVL